MPGDLKSASVSAGRRLLRPVVQLLLRGGITWKEFTEIAKTTFVEVASDEFGIRGRPTNLARVAILTGINRREVARQRDLIANLATPEPVYLNAAQKLLSGWHQDPDYLDVSGAPRALKVDGPAPSFNELCVRYAGDLPAGALLKELKLVAAVAANDGGLVRAVSRVYIPLQMDADKVLRAGSVYEDIGTTLVHDLVCPPGSALRFERRAENDQIDAAAIPEFSAFLELEGQAFLERVDDWLTRHAVRPSQAPLTPPSEESPIRLGVGVYHIQTRGRRGQHS